MTIPDWNAAGVLPPIRPAATGNSPDRSPYAVDLLSLVDRFATSPDRMAILDGMLHFRAALHQAGLVSGFQWFDGSFLEDVEAIEIRAPRDIDVVTFFELPAGATQTTLATGHPALFDHPQNKVSYKVDAYFVVLGQPTGQPQVKTVAYWYSMWSHRRSGLWKGFVQVSLDPAQDAAARALLTTAGRQTP
ncbi:MAG: hypothetical protein H6841_07445 [Planctomycetes bacterium]|nr:hypothetical protein [Planctomycetota bacterium]